MTEPPKQRFSSSTIQAYFIQNPVPGIPDVGSTAVQVLKKKRGIEIYD